PLRAEPGIALSAGSGRHRHRVPGRHAARPDSCRGEPAMTESDNVVVLPVLPLRNSVLFPYLFMPLSVGRPNSVAAVEAVLATEDKNLIVVAQKDAQNEQPGPDDLLTVGTRAVVKKMARGERGVDLLVHGVARAALR